MQMTKKLVVLLLLTVGFAACRKGETYDAEKQLQKDEQLIKDYLAANDLTAERHDSGVYYIISEPGSGTSKYYRDTRVKVTYTGRLLNGSVFDQGTPENPFTLGGLIMGWQIGIPLIQKGGKIRLFIPSVYGYGPQQQARIPANSVLDFDVELLEVINQ